MDPEDSIFTYNHDFGSMFGDLIMEKILKFEMKPI
jgi:hypothetical protein